MILHEFIEFGVFVQISYSALNGVSCSEGFLKVFCSLFNFAKDWLSAPEITCCNWYLIWKVGISADVTTFVILSDFS